MRDRHRLSVAVFVLLLDGNRVLLIRRAGTGWMDGRFSLPGGALEVGETLLSAAQRELVEEVGLLVEPTDLILSYVSHNRTEGNDWIGAYFTALKWTGSETLCEPLKHDLLYWSQVDALPDNVVPYVAEAIGAIINRRSYGEYGWSPSDDNE